MQIRASIKGIIGFGSRLEPALGMTRKKTPVFCSKEVRWASMETTPGGWLERANATLGEYGLQCFLDIKQLAFAIVDPKSPEEVKNCPHDQCCGLC